MSEVKLEKKLVGGKISIYVYDIEESIVMPILEETYDYALHLQKIFSFYDPESELSHLNQKRELEVSNELLEVIKKALYYCKLSKGSYDITLGKQILKQKEGKGFLPVSCSYKDIEIRGNNISLTHEDILVDLGSIAKGYIVDKIVDFLKEKGINNGFIDARGDMKAFGDKIELIEIQHPRDKTKTLFPFSLKDHAVATSGDYNQYHKNFDNSHILNKKEIISATIVSPSAMDADALATVLMVTNKANRESIMLNEKQSKALLIDSDLNQKDYNSFESLSYKRE